MSARREEIVRIAADQFARKGFAATTVREIADEAGILSGSLYHHFASKEAIAEEILAGYYDGMADAFRHIADEADNPLEALAELTRTAYRGISDTPAAVALIQNSPELLRLPGFTHIGAQAEELKEIWLGVIRKGIKTGYFRPAIDARLTYTFIRDAMWVTGRWWRPDGRYTIEQVANHFVDTMFFGISDKPNPGMKPAKAKPAKAAKATANGAAKSNGTAKKTPARASARRT